MKTRKTICILLAVISFSLTPKMFADTPTTMVSQDIDTTNLLATLQYLSYSIGPRTAFSSQEKVTADYLRTQLEQYGYQVFEHPFTRNGYTSQNISAVHPNFPTGIPLILSGHYDSDETSPGANDNASGVAALLEVARLLSITPPQIPVRIVFFGAEEHNRVTTGLTGSRHLLQNLSFPRYQQLYGQINVDMVGYGSRIFIGHSEKSDPFLVNKAIQVGLSEQYPLLYKVMGRDGLDDRYYPERSGIPVVTISRGEPQELWYGDPTKHTPNDVLTHINIQAIKETTTFIYAIVQDLETTDRPENLIVPMPFSDVRINDAFYPLIEEAESVGMIYHYPDGEFHATANVSKAEFLFMLLRHTNATLYRGNEPAPFLDVTSTDWFYPYVMTAFEKGWLNKTNSLKPREAITESEATTILSSAHQIPISTTAPNQPLNRVKALKLILHE